jgi:hypothetical protein
MLGTHRTAVALTAFIALGSFGCAAHDTSVKPTAVPTIPSVAVVGVGTPATVKDNGNGATCIRDRGDFEAVRRALARHNRGAYQNHTQGAKSIALSAGLHVRLLDSPATNDAFTIRLEGGDSAGAVCWMARKRADIFAVIPEGH